MAEDTYRGLLWALGRVRSSADLDYAGRRAVLDHLKKLGWAPKAAAKPKHRHDSWAWVNNAAEDRKPLLRKIAVMLRESDRGKEYADAIAERMHGVSVVEFCVPAQLVKVVASLEADKRRREARG